MLRVTPEWDDVLSLTIDRNSVRLITDAVEITVSCESADSLSRLLQYWARNDQGRVLFPEGIDWTIAQKPAVGI